MVEKNTAEQENIEIPEILEQEVVEEITEPTVEPKAEPTVEEKLLKAEEDLLRALADMQNTRRIADNDVATARKYGVAPLARDLFTVADNLSMALMSISDNDKENNLALKNLSFGLDMVSNEFNSAFEKNGIKKITPKIGDDFDHDTHQAMGEVETDDAEKGKIAQVLSAGYILHDRLLKPAMVNISK